ncbi:MAG TPA: NAD-glutamate dehydrogenase [Caulobacteraceae bacterium]|nr:NAD-glutamate dehydrogenase [Caulobacteraceae bacterium]
MDKIPVAGQPAAFSLEGVREALGHALGRVPDAAEHDFLAQALEDYAPADLPDLTQADFAALCHQIWRLCEAEPRGDLRMDLTPAQGENGRDLSLDLLRIVQIDRPFLVDSVMAELMAQGLTIRAMLHPVITAPEGGLRSVMAVLFEPLDPARRQAMIEGLNGVLADVRAAVEDFPAMLGLMGSTVAELEETAPAGPERDEAVAMLRWLEEGRFVFLGARVYDYPRTPTGRYAHQEPLFERGRSLGVLRDPARGVLRRDNEPAVLTTHVSRFIETGAPLVVAKANQVSRVHRRAYMDYVGVKRYGADGKPVGEVRFVGLFTAEAYDAPAREIPMVRRKTAQVIARAGLGAGSHDARRLNNVLESFPRDELFQIGEDDLLSVALGVVHLYDRPRVRLFVRRDPFDRFVSALVYTPKDRFSAGLAEDAGAILAQAWDGRVTAAYPAFSDAPLARIHYIIGLTPGHHPEPDLAALEAALAEAARTWVDRFEESLRRRGPGAAEARRRYGQAFPVSYQDQFAPAEALADLAVIEALDGEHPVRARVYRFEGDMTDCLRLKLYRLREAILLSDLLPIMEALGLKGLAEHGFLVQPAGGDPVWVHELILRHADRAVIDLGRVGRPIEAAVTAAWTGETESDGFNRLVLELGCSWREAALVRALARYRQQSGMDPGVAVQEATFAAHPEIARLILDLFRVRFDPAMEASLDARRDQAQAAFARIVEALQGVASLDADRVLRRIALLIQACVRTNYYQAGADGSIKPYISFKILSRTLADLPAPKPHAEIFVCAPQVEGVHLRFGPVARGGLRWSDRRDDFRTEVLGLAKAQQVKNAVIVPVGAKGGFYPKQLPRSGSPEAVQQEGVAAYRMFLRGLLDLTDNIGPDGRIVPPEQVVRHDGDDPYLVVAADKGTATFSDIANAMADSYGFWLGDAFASGGSAGYDHKAMGITARGAWEAIKRHFRELGKDIQAEPFTVAGVGDMSGDVFGNGMLLSRQTRLVAAFDHRHVFLDPDPDPETSWAERKRLFDLPRSSWGSYDIDRISKGGGVYARQSKSIPVSPEVAALLGIPAEPLTPQELIKAILKAPVDLLYFGGIGAYVKAPTQSHLDVGDKANDAIRVDATQLRAKVVGEGANLAVTQAGRIVFARAGGRIDTDAIDNSAGVDTSDHEVNIKILTSAAERAGSLSRPDRDALLQSMTGEVAAHVLAHNHDQTLALSLQERSAAADLDSYGRFMVELEAAGRLDRAVEGLPSAAEIAELGKAGKGLTRPELAVLMAYGKLELSAAIVASAAPDDPFFQGALQRYFPAPLQRFAREMQEHPLRREIIATSLANTIVDICGPTFAGRVRAATGCDVDGMATAFEAAWRIFRLDELWRQIGALDAKPAAAKGQLALYAQVSNALRGQVYWLARRVVGGETGVQDLIDAYRPAADALREAGTGLLSPLDQADVTRRAAEAVAEGAPEDLAVGAALLGPLLPLSDMAHLAREGGWTITAASRAYHAVGHSFAFDRLKAAAFSLLLGDYYQRQAARHLIDDLYREQAALTRSVIAETRSEPQDDAGTQAAVEAWSARRQAEAGAVQRLVAEIEASDGGWTFAKMTVANAALRGLAAEG